MANAKRAAAAGARRADRADDREIGPIPAVANPARRATCRENFERFCREYFPELFTFAFSEAHLRLIRTAESVARFGGRYAQAFPRGFGKTTLCEIAALWAILYGYSRYVVIVGADEGAGGQNIDNIIAQLQENDALLEDFPEACFPIRKLEGIKQRAAGQTSGGERTKIGIKADRIILPSVRVQTEGGALALAATADATIQSRGLTGRIRGLGRTVTGGKKIRPDLVLIDDPQTDQSAESETETNKREGVIKSTIMRLAGPGKEIRALMPMTVIRHGDLAHRFLDGQRNPAWIADRVPMLETLPTEQALKVWLEEYREFRARCDKETRAAKCAEFYLAHRAEMSAGAKATWEELHNRDDGVREVDALQHAMNIWVDDGKETFLSECQNAPEDPLSDPASRLDADEVAKRLTRTKRGEVPPDANLLTAFVDCGKGGASNMHFVVIAWNDKCATGTAIDYGTVEAGWKAAKDGVDEELRRVLTLVCKRILDAEFLDSGGNRFRVEALAIDAGWKMDAVCRFCRECAWEDRVVPSRGEGVQPGREFRYVKPYRSGDHWRLAPTNLTKKGGQRVFTYDANYWKDWTFERWRTALGSRGRLAIFGDDFLAHWTFAEEVAGEFRELVIAGNGMACNLWKPRPGRSNHFWDCCVGNSALANKQGVRLDEGGGAAATPRVVSFAEQQRRAKMRGR